MPLFTSKVELTNAASSSKIVLADVDLIKGAFKVYPSLSTIQGESLNYFADKQIVMAGNTSRLYQATITPADFITVFEDSASFTEFTFTGLSADVPSGTISGSTQISAFGYILSSQTSSFVLSSQTSSYALKTDISGAFTSVSGGLAGRITTLEGTAGGSTDITALNLFTGSIQIQVNNLTSATSSYALKTDVSGAFTSVSSSVSTRLTSLEGTSGGDVTALNLFTGSAQTSLTALNSATSSYVTSANTGSFIRNSQTSSMSVLSALTASFISDIFISASAVRSGFGTALFPSGLLSSSFQIATDISGAFTSLSSSFASRITTLEGAGGGNGIFTLTGSFYSTTNNIQITGSLSVGSGSFKSFEVNSDGFVVLGDMNKDLNTAPIGTVVYSGSNFYLIS